MGTMKKGKNEGGSGGRRGHSNMEHWGYNDEVKASARRLRRLDTKAAISEGLREKETFALNKDLEREGAKATRFLRGKKVNTIKRHRPGELYIEFTDGTRLFVDASDGRIELSIT